MYKLMKTLITLFVGIACYYLLVPLVLFPFVFLLVPNNMRESGVPGIVFLPIVIIICYFVWRSISESLTSYILMIGIIVGFIGFSLGFFGSIIFAPDANQGPLLGIFITGPLGFFIGSVGGGIFWSKKKKNNKI